MAKNRNTRNTGLPKYWRYHNGSYSYRVPVRFRALVENKQEIGLGQSMQEAEAKYKKVLRTIVSAMEPRAVQPLHTTEEIFSRAIPYHGLYLYFLFEDGQCVYVGKSSRPYDRINTHRIHGKTFDTISVVSPPLPDVHELELRYIQHLQPRYNTLGIAA